MRESTFVPLENPEGVSVRFIDNLWERYVEEGRRSETFGSSESIAEFLGRNVDDEQMRSGISEEFKKRLDRSFRDTVAGRP